MTMLGLANLFGVAFCVATSALIVSSGFSPFPFDRAVQIVWVAFSVLLIASNALAFRAWKRRHLDAARFILLIEFLVFWIGLAMFLYVVSFR